MSLDNHALQTDASTEAAPARGSAAQARSWNAKRCPSCDTPVLYNQTVCAECGTRLTPHVTKVRCRQCGQRATSDHVICPHCGRALRAAPSRILTIGAPLLLVGALTLAIIVRAPTLPARLAPNASGSLSLLQNIVITPVPATNEADSMVAANDNLAPIIINSPAGQAEASSPLALNSAEESTPLIVAQVNDVVLSQNPEAAPPTSEVESNQTAIPLPTETAIPTPTVETTPTPTSPAPTATSTPVADLRYTIKAGDTIIGIAQRFGISADTLLEANALTERDASNLQIGREIVLPGIKPSATPSATATATDIPLRSQHPNPSTQWTVYLEMVL